MTKDRTEYIVTTPSGKVVALYCQEGSLYNFRVTVNGNTQREFKTLGDAYRHYNETIVAVG